MNMNRFQKRFMFSNSQGFTWPLARISESEDALASAVMCRSSGYRLEIGRTGIESNLFCNNGVTEIQTGVIGKGVGPPLRSDCPYDVRWSLRESSHWPISGHRRQAMVI